TITGATTVTVNPASGMATSIVVAGYPSSVTAGTAHNFTVTMTDTNGSTVTGYTGTVTFSSTDTKGVLPANYTFTSTDAGVHIFSATLKIAGSQSLTAKDTVTSSITGSQSGITVIHGKANHLAVSRFPSKTTAGTAQSFRVTAQDPYGNTDTSYAGTVAFSSTDGQAVLPGNYTFTSTDVGICTFSAALKTASSSQSLTVQDTTNVNVASGTQSGITVNPAATNQLQVSGFPISLIAGTAANFTVTAKDPYGNTTPAYVGTVTFTSSDSQAVLPSSCTFTSTDAGGHTFSATLKTVGTQSLSATDMASASMTGSQTGISVVSVRPTPTISGPSSGVPGQPLTFVLGASESGLPAGTIYSYSVQWGDGSAVQTFSGPSGTQATHGFLGTGVTTVTVTATDAKGNLSAPVSSSVSLSTVLMETDPYNSSLTALYVGGTVGDDNIAITPVAGGGVKLGMNLVNYGSF